MDFLFLLLFRFIFLLLKMPSTCALSTTPTAVSSPQTRSFISDDFFFSFARMKVSGEFQSPSVMRESSKFDETKKATVIDISLLSTSGINGRKQQNESH